MTVLPTTVLHISRTLHFRSGPDCEGASVRRMRWNLGKAIALALALAACGPAQRDPGTNPDAGDGGGGDDGGGGGNNNGDGCSDAAKLVYVVDQNRRLSQFDPPTRTFTDLGTLACPASGGATPFSMGIARDATAWVVYSNGELFRVETRNNLACTKSAWVPNTQGLRVFGMGFSTDQAGGTTDTLFIAGGNAPSQTTPATLAKLDMNTFQPMTRGSVAGWPELTGTGAAELWGFFPQTQSQSARIVQLDKTTGAALRTYQAPMLNESSPTIQPQAWAFAFHGGSFWVFLMKSADAETRVYQFDAGTGTLTGTTPSGGRKIVGAGVSTCAPIIL